MESPPILYERWCPVVILHGKRGCMQKHMASRQNPMSGIGPGHPYAPGWCRCAAGGVVGACRCLLLLLFAFCARLVRTRLGHRVFPGYIKPAHYQHIALFPAKRNGYSRDGGCRCLRRLLFAFCARLVRKRLGHRVFPGYTKTAHYRHIALCPTKRNGYMQRLTPIPGHDPLN